MIGALERPTVAGLRDDLVAAVAADVDEAAELTVPVPDDHDRDVPDASQAAESPGSASLPTWPKYCHEPGKIRTSSSSAIAGSVYHDAGSV